LGWSEARTVPPVDRPPSVAVAAIPGGRVHLPPPTDGKGRAQPGAEGLDRDVAPFLLATHELRRDQWASWLPTRPWVTDDPEGGCGGARPRHPGMGVLDLLDDDRPSPAAGSGDDLPATCISFAEAAWVANLLSRRDGLRPAYRIADGEVTWDRRADGWRLPTEAEWLQALAADPTLLPPPDDPGACARANLAEPRGWRAKDAPPPCEDGYAGPSPVGTFPPSAQGIHDLVGNVAEWVWGDRATLDEPDHLRPHAAFAKGPTHASRGWGRARDERAFLGGQRSSVVGLRFARSAEGAR
ncbi:MAG: SUMF1/EgtB/PvdO family nonheme iron enzyme, partial [Myxococcales bacterium]|nr:SUMF1/EgtB/PvdO family nonheme iron enzyme [Myxococcales bacterium]